MIASTTVIVGVATQIVWVVLVLQTLSKLYDNLELYWITFVLFHSSLISIMMAVVRFLNFMMKPKLSVSPRSRGWSTLNLLNRVRAYAGSQDRERSVHPQPK